MSIAQALSGYLKGDLIKSIRATSSDFREHIIFYPLIHTLYLDQIWEYKLNHLNRLNDITLRFHEFSVSKEFSKVDKFLRRGGFRLSCITSLDLSECSDLSYKCMKALMNLPPNLTHLDLSGQSLSHGSIGILTKALKRSKVINLTLVNTTIDISLLCDGMSKIQTLNLRNNKHILAPTLMKLLRSDMPNMRHIDLSDNWLESMGIFELPVFTQLETLKCHLTHLSLDNLSRDMTRLKSLDLSFNRLGSINSLLCMKQLITLNIAYNGLDYTCIPIINSLTNLQSLNLGYNKDIMNKGIASLDISRLTSLNIQGTLAKEFENGMCEEFITKLQTATRLESLNLADTNLPFTTKVIQAFCCLTNLQHLNLSKNLLGDDFFAAMTPAFKNLSSLRTLDISRNLFGYCVSDVPALRYLKKLESINYCEYRLKDEYKEAIHRELNMI